MADDSRRLRDALDELADLPHEVDRQRRDLDDTPNGRGQEQRIRKAALQRADELAREIVQQVRGEVYGDEPTREEAQQVAEKAARGGML